MVEGTERPPFDQAKAAWLVAKYVLIGLTYEDEAGNVIRQKQLHGVIESASETDGFSIRLCGAHAGQKYSLPPDTRAFTAAVRGEYRLRSTGEVITNPDVLATWFVTEPSAKDQGESQGIVRGRPN